MLAQTFKSAAELNLSEKAYDTLVKVYWLLVDETIPKELFDMRTIGAPFLKQDVVCGTPGCILGWCNAVAPGAVDPRKMETPLSMLFYHRGACNEKRTPKQAAQAIHTYLTTGQEGWTQAIKG